MLKSKQEAEIRVRVRRNPRRFIRKVVLVLITCYLVYLLYGFVHDAVVVRLAKAQQVPEGFIQKTLAVNGVIVRNEKLVSAPRSGKLKVIAAEGERVRVGQIVAQVIVPSLDSKTGEAVFNIITPSAGLVSYHLDGLEEIFTPVRIKELDLNKIDTIKSELRQMLPGNQVEAGKPVLKVVNNLDFLNIVATVQEGMVLQKNKSKTILLALGEDDNDLSQGTILEENFHGQPNQILLGIKDYDVRMLVGRQIDFKLVTERYTGYILPASAIVSKDGENGIFTVYEERVKWKKVEVKGSTTESVAISGITPDIIVILCPEYVKEGSPFR